MRKTVLRGRRVRVRGRSARTGPAQPVRPVIERDTDEPQTDQPLPLWAVTLALTLAFGLLFVWTLWRPLTP